MSEPVALEQALQAVVGETDVVLQAVACVVFMDEDGQKMISHLRSTDLRTWEASGLIEDYRQSLAGFEIWRQMEDD